MHAGAIAGLIAAGAFVLLVLLLAIPLLKLGKTLDEATLALRKTHEGAAPLLTGAQTTVANVNSQLAQLEDITRGVGSITSNAAALTSIVSSTVGSPLIKVAAFSYGVRSTVKKRQDAQAVTDARRSRLDTRRSRRAARRGSR
ncbi:MAG TPA: DUF948 domain-containing protein [Jatrophihabitans sp.]|nr:DUF948 domain-containing protein [Jatrophihabitans sp.]